MRTNPGTAPNIFVNGRPLMAQVRWGDLKLTDRWPYGCWEAQWSVLVKPYQRIPALVPGAVVRAKIGSATRWIGLLGKPDWDTGQMTAYGLARQGEETLAINNTSGETTSIPDTAIDHAIARGLLWIRRASLSSAVFGEADETLRLHYLTALLDAYCLSIKSKWGVNARREIYVASDAATLAATPSMVIRPGAGELGVSNVNQAARIFGRFMTSTGVYTNVNVGEGLPEVGVSLEQHGVLDATKATAIITGIRDAVQPKAGFSNGVTVTKDMVTTIGGQKMGLAQVVADGRSARMVGLRDERARLAHTDVVLAESVWDVSEEHVTVTPVGMEATTLAEVVEAAGGVLL